MARAGSRWVVSAFLVLAIPSAASADKCLATRTMSLAKVTWAYLLCQSKAAKTGDEAGIEVCRDEARETFIKKWDKGRDCGPVQTLCESSARSCETAVAAAITGTLPDKCVAAKRKAAAKLAKALIGCGADSAKSGDPVDDACRQAATAKFQKALAKAGDCEDGGSPVALVDDSCVAPPIDTNGSGVVIGVCMDSPPPPDTTSSTLPATTSTLPATTTTLVETCTATDQQVCLQYRDSAACSACCQSSGGACGAGNCMDGAFLYSCSLLASQCRNDIENAGCTAECCP
ncbi:MAG TPA: hypothetical protein VEL28_02985 [Candidatus Binatia bacterium]|nr:hypothetical protein [Candidatus Binatia bacterium]